VDVVTGDGVPIDHGERRPGRGRPATSLERPGPWFAQNGTLVHAEPCRFESHDEFSRRGVVLRHAFETSRGPVEVIVDEDSRTVSLYRFDGARRAVAAAMESWDYVDLTDLLTRQIGVAPADAEEIASRVRGTHTALRLMSPPVEHPPSRPDDSGDLEKAGLLRRFVALLLDAVIVFFPLSIVVGLVFGGGYLERGNGYANAGVNVTGTAFWAFSALGLTYYIVCEALTGMTVGKRIVGIRVVAEDGEHLSLGAAVIRNLLRPVDSLFFFLVGALFALTSSRRQRLGDRAAGTLVIRG
jgi:uncharacterized RDD family membrane protein YckC